jgi:hypothetical protein
VAVAEKAEAGNRRGATMRIKRHFVVSTEIVVPGALVRTTELAPERREDQRPSGHRRVPSCSTLEQTTARFASQQTRLSAGASRELMKTVGNLAASGN